MSCSFVLCKLHAAALTFCSWECGGSTAHPDQRRAGIAAPPGSHAPRSQFLRQRAVLAAVLPRAKHSQFASKNY
jgi:hypothetical protein